MRLARRSLHAIILASFAARSTVSSGAKYTLSRVDRDLTLAPAHTAAEPRDDDTVGKVVGSRLQIVPSGAGIAFQLRLADESLTQ